MCDHDDSFDGPDWMDIALAGSLAAEMADDERERERIRKEMEEERDEDDEDQADP